MCNHLCLVRSIVFIETHLVQKKNVFFVCVVGALKLVSHPNVVRLEAVHEDPRSISIVMTLCRGGDLWDKVRGFGCGGGVIFARGGSDDCGCRDPLQGIIGLRGFGGVRISGCIFPWGARGSESVTPHS